MTPDEWEHLLGFVGYGRIDAPVVFIGHEERAHDGDDLRGRLAWDPVMDLGIATGADRHNRMSDNNSVQWTWRPMCHLMLYEENRKTPITAERKAYQAQRLGRSKEHALLTELFPIPQPNARAWSGPATARWATREQYEKAVWPQRRELLEQLLWRHERKVIVCYTKGSWRWHKELFPGATWECFDSRSDMHIARLNGTNIILTHAFAWQKLRPERALAGLATAAFNP